MSILLGLTSMSHNQGLVRCIVADHALQLIGTIMSIKLDKDGKETASANIRQAVRSMQVCLA